MNSESRTASTAHTPGPWIVAHTNKAADGNYGIGFAVPCIIASNGPTIAELLRSDRAAADAALIAAAPDMLAALQNLLVVSDAECIRGSSHEPIERAKAIIAKATGA